MWILLFSIIRQFSASAMLRLLALGSGMGEVGCCRVFITGQRDNKGVSIIQANLVMEIQMTRYDFQSGDFQVVVF
jgi:hypothetical protein